jgi:hypothetical protein
VRAVNSVSVNLQWVASCSAVIVPGSTRAALHRLTSCAVTLAEKAIVWLPPLSSY